MMDWAGVTLLRPWWLLGLSLIGLCLLAARGGGRLAGWSAAVDPHLLAALERLGAVLPGRGPGLRLPAAVACLLALALSGPALRTGEAPTFRNLDGVAIVMDLSRSMAPGGALPQAVAAGRLVAQGSGGRPVALVVYAGDAYLASPFTTDPAALATMISALDGETVPDQGSCLGCALALTGDMLEQAEMAASDVVVIGDGAGAGAAREAVDRLRAAGARVSTLYAAPSLAPSDLPAPEPGALAALAARGGGRAGEAARPARVLDLLATAPASGAAAADLALLTHLDLGRYLLALPALLALGLFRRGA